MATRKAKNKKTRRQLVKSPKPRMVVYTIGVALIIILAWWFVGSYYEDTRSEAVESTQMVSLADPNAYKNLDLREAAKATYSGLPIKTVKELGVKNNVDHTIVSFSVLKDNLTENALMTTPTTLKPKDGYPVLILCHGYANPWQYSTTNAYVHDMEAYSQNGFVVIKPDFRGQGMSIPDGSPEGAYYSMAYNTDVLSLIAAVKNSAGLNKNDISIWGHSMGGYIALRAAVLSPDIKNVILLSAPVGYIQDMFSAYIAISDASNPAAATIRAQELDQHGTPLSNPDYWENTSPINFLTRTKAHIQIHVGTSDTVVPAHFSQDLDTQLNKLNKVHSYYVYSNGAHGLVRERQTILARSLELMTNNK